MRKPDLMTVLIVMLCVCVGVVLGQGFSFEVKISDLITLSATCITFYFAYTGLRHSKDIYYNSVRPILYIEDLVDHDDFIYKLSIKNCGTGPAVGIEYKLYYEGSTLSESEFIDILHKNIPGVRFVLSAHAGYTSMEKLLVIEIKLRHKQKEHFDLLKRIVDNLQAEVTYHSILDDKYVVKYNR